MPITIVKGDIRKTQAQALLLGMNTEGRVEVTTLETALRDQYPVFYSEHRRLGRSGAFTPGELWFFRDSSPWLVGLMIREAPNGINRVRHLEQAMLTLRRDWQREALRSIAIAPLGDRLEWGILKEVLEDYLHALPIPVIVYDEHIPGINAAEPGRQT